MTKTFSLTALSVAAAAMLAVALPAAANHIPGSPANDGQPFTVTPTAIGEAQTSFEALAINFNYAATVSQTTGGVFTESGLATFSTFNIPFNTPLPASLTGLNQGPGTTGYNLYATFTATGTTAPAAGGGLNGVFETFVVNFIADPDRNTTTTSGTTPGGTTTDDVTVATGSLLNGGFHVFPGLANGDFAVRVAANAVGGFFSGIPIIDMTGVNTSIIGVGPGAFQNATILGSGNVQAIPEPETYALMLAGLGALGFVARRRRRT
jgi:hypothetical protein